MEYREMELYIRNYGHTMSFGGTWIDIPYRQTIIPKKEKYLCLHCLSIIQVDANFNGIIRCGYCGAPVKPLKDALLGK